MGVGGWGPAVGPDLVGPALAYLALVVRLVAVDLTSEAVVFPVCSGSVHCPEPHGTSVLALAIEGFCLALPGGVHSIDEIGRQTIGNLTLSYLNRLM